MASPGNGQDDVQVTVTSFPPAAVRLAAERLRAAEHSRSLCSPVRDLIGANDVSTAYAVQEQLTTARTTDGATIVGRKIGLTSHAVQVQLGVDSPDFGVLFDDMEYASGDVVPSDAILQPRAEAEIAFVLKSDLIDGPLDTEQIRRSIEYACAALEICGSRIADWDISFGDTVADNASAGAFVLGAARMGLAQFEPREAVMKMTINEDIASTGTGAACLGDPLNAVTWLARQARDLGRPLTAGQVILSGALGPMRPIQPGDRVRATISTLGAVQFSLSEQDR